MDTDLSLNQIECALAEYFDIRKNIIVCNVSWGLLDHEADMLIMNKSGYLTEVEIKRSFSDFKADFKKDRDLSSIKYFYYAIPERIRGKCEVLLIEKNMSSHGIITYSEDCKLRTHQDSRITIGRKLYIEEQLQLARLGAMRVWNFKKKMINPNLFDKPILNVKGRLGFWDYPIGDKEKQCPEIPYFGATYPDATCIDGYLWDLDSHEDGKGLTQGGDAPCPFCNTETWLENSWLIEEGNTIESGLIWIEKMRERYDSKS